MKINKDSSTCKHPPESLKDLKKIPDKTEKNWGDDDLIAFRLSVATCVV